MEWMVNKSALPAMTSLGGINILVCVVICVAGGVDRIEVSSTSGSTRHGLGFNPREFLKLVLKHTKRGIRNLGETCCKDQ